MESIILSHPLNYFSFFANSSTPSVKKHMSTNSSIILEMPDSTYNSVYVHSDGYLGYNGVILQRCFKTFDQVQALISLGDISYLTACFETVMSYHRWRGDPISITKSMMLEDHALYEYNYLFVYNEWQVKQTRAVWRPLAPLVEHMPMPRISESTQTFIAMS